MQQNIWDNLSAIKEQVARYAKSAKENEWISTKECDEILEKLEKDTLTIGVIGQIKCGKSTFLNALLFKDNVLPVASTPMTAALSVITYGEKEEVTAEFYMPEEWGDIEDQATLTGDDPKIKAAKELVEQSKVLGSRLNRLLGTTQSASFSDLEKYVGAKGEYVAITKSVTIKYPEERLKGVQVVDTPGFNDPVVSREARTTEFLAKADVVILLLYAGKPFDATDKDILFEKVKKVGVGKIIIGVNKYDLAIANGELEETIRAYIISEIAKAVREKNDVVLNGLLRDPNPILLSAHMALLGLMPMSKIKSNEDLEWHYKKFRRKFDINTQSEILEKSKLSELENEINALLANGKIEVLIRKPINEIQGKINSKKAKYEAQLLALSEKKKNLSLNDKDLEAKLKTYKDAKEKIEYHIHNKKLDMEEFVNERIQDTESKLEKERSTDMSHLRNITEDKSSKEKTKSKIEYALININILFIDKYKDTHKEIKSKFKKISDDLIGDLGEIIGGYSDDKKKIKYCMASYREELLKFDNISFEDLFSLKDVKKGSENDLGIVDIILIAIARGIGLGFIHQQYQKRKYKEELTEQVKDLMPKDAIKKSFDPIRKHVNDFIDFFTTRFLNDLLDPVIKSIEKIQQEKCDKELEKKEVEKEIIKLENKKEELKIQLDDINNYIKTM
ncbi:Bacterial dynamin-like protein [termite gut metagenome]|uniref:Bacterial dynamin-like protein n=1 Tax=termite gut metagenome TaxID=433724 RepID=A0A5J4RU44_9ZZZZ